MDIQLVSSHRGTNASSRATGVASRLRRSAGTTANNRNQDLRTRSRDTSVDFAQRSQIFELPRRNKSFDCDVLPLRIGLSWCLPINAAVLQADFYTSLERPLAS
jgi:hypothetical protein